MFLSYAIKRYPNYIIFREVVPFIIYFEKLVKRQCNFVLRNMLRSGVNILPFIWLFWLQNIFEFLALFRKVFGRGDVVSPQKWKTFPKFEKRLKRNKKKNSMLCEITTVLLNLTTLILNLLNGRAMIHYKSFSK